MFSRDTQHPHTPCCIGDSCCLLLWDYHRLQAAAVSLHNLFKSQDSITDMFLCRVFCIPGNSAPHSLNSLVVLYPDLCIYVAEQKVCSSLAGLCPFNQSSSDCRLRRLASVAAADSHFQIFGIVVLSNGACCSFVQISFPTPQLVCSFPYGSHGEPDRKRW